MMRGLCTGLRAISASFQGGLFHIFISVKNIKRFTPNGLYNGAKMASYEEKEYKEALNDNSDKKQLFANIGGKLGSEVGTMLDELVDGLEEVEENEEGGVLPVEGVGERI